ncbi:Uncharacterised protein [Klebsiella pneumoniae]|nr:Uncharacterised protein [Klebsiella pneumoniae]
MADNRIVGGGFTDDQRAHLRQRCGGDQRPRAVAAGLFSAGYQQYRAASGEDRFPLMNAGDGKRRYRRFHIAGSAAIKTPVFHLRAERIVLPAAISQRDGIQMSGKGQRFTALRPGQAGDKIAASFAERRQRNLKTAIVKPVGEEPHAVGFAARRVDGVKAQQLPGELKSRGHQRRSVSQSRQLIHSWR